MVYEIYPKKAIKKNKPTSIKVVVMTKVTFFPQVGTYEEDR